MLATVQIVIFLLIFALVMLVVSAGLRYLEADRKKKVSSALGTRRGAAAPSGAIALFDTSEGGAHGKAPLSVRLPFLSRLQQRIYQADLDWSVGRLLFMMAAGAAVGAFLGTRVTVPVFRELTALGMGILFGVLPYAYVARKRSRRLGEFEEQFPEALDFMARSMRAGHAFSVSLEMMAEESPDPMGAEFRKVFHEQNLGAPIEVALRNLAGRVPLVDVRFFVSAVLLQRETGGNLAEILTNLSYVIRERFRLKGQVRAVSAHGRVTAGVLTVMPIATVAALMVVAPSYLRSMADDPTGRYLIFGAIVAQFLGYYFIRKIIDIKV